MTTTYNVKTDRFSGKCEKCIYPIVVESSTAYGNFTTVSCPGCSAKVELERLYGSYSDQNCDARCQYALGRICSCACGGANHQSGYLVPKLTGYLPAHVVEAYRVSVAKHKASAAKASATKAAKKQAAADELAEAKAAESIAWQIDNSHLVAWLQANAEKSEFAASLQQWVIDNGKLTERQGLAVEKAIQRDLAKAAEHVDSKPAPVGAGIVVEGVVVAVKEVADPYSYNGGNTYKMIVKSDDGWKVYLSVPSGLGLYELTGSRLRFTANLEASKSKPDAFFVFGKRPRKCVVLQAA
jgi:hypothetical protein